MRHLLLVMFILSSVVANGQEATRVLGSNIYLNIPEGFELDSNSLNTYYNFKKEYITARVVNQSYDVIKPLASWEFYKSYGSNKFVREDSITISGYKGIIFECIMNDIHHSYQITVGDSTQTFQIIAACYNNNALVKSSFEEMFNNVKILKDQEIPWDDQLGFTVDGAQDFNRGITNFNSITLYPEDGIQIDLTRVVGLNVKNQNSEELLINKGNIGWSERQEYKVADSSLHAEKTFFNDQKAILLKTHCKDASNDVLLVEAIIEGKTQRIFVFCKIKKDLETKEINLLRFLDRIHVK